MFKLCYLIVLLFVIKIAIGEYDFECICPGPIGIEHRIQPNVDVDKKSLICNCHNIFGESNTTDTDRNVERLDSLDREIEKNDTFISLLSGIETLIKYVVHPRSCIEAPSSGLYDIQIKKYGDVPFTVYCETELFGGDWTVVARRMDGSINFDRNWTEYKHGFGDVDGEFFIGMDKLHALTNGQQTQELIFVLEDFENYKAYAKYSEFAIGDESEGYIIKALGDYSGDAGDSFSLHGYQTFKTKDRDSTDGCTNYGAWWHKDCHQSNLFGSYLKGHLDESNKGNGIVWHHFRGDYYSLRFAEMMIRPKQS